MGTKRAQTSEIHQRVTRLGFGPREFREFILDALREKKIDVSGDVQITFTGVNYQDNSSLIGGGPSVGIVIRQDIGARE